MYVNIPRSVQILMATNLKFGPPLAAVRDVKPITKSLFMYLYVCTLSF